MEVVKVLLEDKRILLEDKRIDPSVNNNLAMECAREGGDLEIVDLLKKKCSKNIINMILSGLANLIFIHRNITWNHFTNETKNFNKFNINSAFGWNLY